MEKITKSSDKVLIDPNEPLILPDGTALVGRVEWFLYALCCLDYQNLPTPMSRIEEFANALITGEVPNIEPQSRAEQFFLAILDGNVSNLPQPQSRSEILLDKLARGEFDLSDVEPIQSRYELLLAYLIKNGGIGNIDYVLYEFSEAMKTMYNTVEKPFKSLELSGNTLVNCVLEDTENDDYTSFDKDYSGTSFTINGTSEGAIKSAILKGQTLVNSRGNAVSSIGWSTTDGIEYIVEGNNSFLNFECTLLPNTKYLIFFEFDGRGVGVQYGTRPANGGWDNAYLTTTDGICKKVITTGSGSQWLSFIVPNSFTVTDYVKISRIMIIPYQDGMESWNIPYFEGMQSVKMPVLSTVGKNLFKPFRTYTTKGLTFTITNGQLYVDGTATDTVDYYLTTKGGDGGTYDFINNNIPVGTTLTLSNNLGLRNHFGYYLDGVEKDYWGNDSLAITSNTSNIRCFVRFLTGQSFSNQPLNIQLEQGTVATSYEPYKTNILTVNEDVELRGIGNVKDELNLMTGELTQRICKIVLDGSEEWIKDMFKDDDTFLNIVFKTKIDNIIDYNDLNTGMLSDRFKQATGGSLWTEDISGIGGANGFIKIGVPKSYLTSADSDGFKQWLSQNPVTVQYQLATESIKTVDLNVVDQNNTKIDKIHVFNEVTHVNASSDELTPTVNISKSVSYPTIIKPNTKYTVDLKRNNKPLTVDLGGTEVTFTGDETRKTITTPNTLVNDKLSYYGVGAKCNEIMLIEGEIERNVDYFTGMQSVVMQNQMPILSTVGKNLLSTHNVNSSNSQGVSLTKSSDGTLSLCGIPTRSWGNHNLNCVLRKDVKYIFQLFINGTKQTSNFKLWGYNTTNPSELIANVSLNGSFIPQTDIILFLVWEKFETGTPLDITNITIQIEEGYVVTSYEPYKSSILSCNDDVTLRGIGDVKDELDLMNGELTQRIGEIVLDDSNVEGWRSYETKGEYSVAKFTLPSNALSNGGAIPSVNVKCDKMKVETVNQEGSQEQISVYYHGANGNYSELRLCLLTSKLTPADIEGIRTYVKNNPFTIQYQLKTESVKTVGLNVVDQDGNTIPKIKSYNGVTHLEVTVPKQSLLPNVSAEVATDNSKDMSSLATKHQEISEAQSAIQNSIQSQSDEIDTAMMATTEIFESILE